MKTCDAPGCTGLATHMRGAKDFCINHAERRDDVRALVLALESEAAAYGIEDRLPPDIGLHQTVNMACRATAAVVLYDAAARLRKALGMEPRVPLLDLTTEDEHVRNA